MNEDRKICADARRVVVKIGSRVLIGDGPSVIDRSVFVPLLQSIAEEVVLRERRLVLVSSGSIALGRGRLRDSRRYGSLARLQALAALGQSALMQLYEHEFAFHNLLVGQVLLTQADIDDRRRFINARHTLRLLSEEMGAIPIVNENDTVANDEIRLGDNDRLAALVSLLFDADLLVILSDVDGLFPVDPATDKSAAILSRIEPEDPSIDGMIWQTETGPGRGGMTTKVEAARMAAKAGIPTVVARGSEPTNLARVLRGEDVGTLFLPRDSALSARRLWLLHGINTAGRLVIDHGAVDAIVKRGKSLLPSGIQSVEGKFSEGAAIEIADPDGNVVARGLASYASSDMARIAGHQSGEIADILGFRHLDSVVHRDDMVLVGD